MRQATKQWLFLLFLVLSLLAMIALALRQMAKARREAARFAGLPIYRDGPRLSAAQPSCSASATASRSRGVCRRGENSSKGSTCSSASTGKTRIFRSIGWRRSAWARRTIVCAR